MCSSDLVVARIPPPAPIDDACFSPDGALLATACRDGSVQVRRLDSSSGVPAVWRHQGVVRRIEFSDDGSTVASCGTDGKVQVRSIDGEPICPAISLSGAAVEIAVDASGRSIFASSADGRATLWQIENGRAIKAMEHQIGRAHV